jgi:hypothetical protein
MKRGEKEGAMIFLDAITFRIALSSGYWWLLKV